MNAHVCKSVSQLDSKSNECQFESDLGHPEVLDELVRLSEELGLYDMTDNPLKKE